MQIIRHLFTVCYVDDPSLGPSRYPGRGLLEPFLEVRLPRKGNTLQSQQAAFEGHTAGGGKTAERTVTGNNSVTGNNNRQRIAG